MKKNIGGLIKITNEMMALILGLPDGVRVSSAQSDITRDIIDIQVQSDKEVEGLTQPRGEGQEYPCVADPQTLLLKAAISTANALMTSDPKLYAELSQEIEEGK